jgi:CPA2 family monovalent cation:H+ antiporter-2
VILALLATAAWRSAQNLEGHIRAGAELLVEAVRSTLPPEHGTAEMPVPKLEDHADRFVTATHMVPGLGAPTPFRVEASHFAAGRTLAELGLRGRTGASVLGLSRDGNGIAAPSKDQRIEAGDMLILVGTRESVREAETVLRGAPDLVSAVR